MLRRVVAAVLRPRRAAAAGLVVVAAVGFAALPDARERALPPVGPLVLQVRTATPTLSSGDVERLVTAPLETDLRTNVTTLESVHSTSRAGLSILNLRFRVGSSIDRTRQAVQDRLTLARLPGTPRLISPADRLSLVALHTSLSPAALADLVEQQIQPQLLGVSGVANVWLWGESGPLLVIEQLRDVDTIAVTARVEHRLEELAPGLLPELQFDLRAYRAADYLNAARHQLARTVGWTALAVLLGLAVLLLDWRRAVLTALAAPIPVAIGLVALRAHGDALDAMTLTGLAAAVPLVLFDAVVLSEVGVRAQRDRAGDPVGRLTTMVRRLVRASLLLAVALVPVLFLSGLPERPFLPRIAATFAIGLVATAGTALLFVPAVLGALPGRPARSPARRVLRVGHDRLVWPLVRPAVAVVVLAGLLAAGAVACTQVTTRLRPAFHDPAVSVRLQAWPGTAPAEVAAARDRIVNRLRGLPGVRAVTALPECAESPAGDGGAGCADVALTLGRGADRADTLSAVRGALAAESLGMFLQLDAVLNTQLAGVVDRSRAALVVRVSGADRAALGARAEAVRAALSGLPGVIAPAVTGAPDVIEHLDTSNVLEVEAGVSGRDHGAVRAEVRATLARLAPAAGTDVQLVDAGTDRHRPLAAGLAIGAALLLFLVGALGVRGALLVGLAGVPAVLGAGVVALWIDGAPLGPGGLAGLVVLGGLLLRAALLLVPDLHRAGPDDDARRIAAGAHAAPLLQACAVLAGATVPWLMTGQRAGTEQLHPFAVVLFGGILAVALVNLLALPGLIGGIGRRRTPGDGSPGPAREAETPMSVSRWIDQVDTGRSSASDRHD